MTTQITEGLVTAATRLTANTVSCGVGGGLSSFRETIGEVTTTINEAITAANDVIAAVQNLPTLIAQEVSTAAESLLNNLVSELEIPEAKLPDEIRSLLELVSDPGAFIAKYLDIAALFPNVDLDKILNDILTIPNFDICSMVPNFQVINGEVAERAAENPPPTGNATESPAQAEIPATPTPEPPPNTSAASQRVIVEQLPPVGENRGLTEQQRQSRTSQYSAELDENNNQRAALLAQLENAVPGSAEYNSLLDERDRLNEEAARIRAGRPN